MKLITFYDFMNEKKESEKLKAQKEEEEEKKVEPKLKEYREFKQVELMKENLATFIEATESIVK